MRRDSLDGSDWAQYIAGDNADSRRNDRRLMQKPAADNQYLFTGLIRLHILHHAAEEPVYGLAMIEELGRHGYKLSAGTLYPILHGLEKRGYLVSTKQKNGRSQRIVYRATRNGRTVLRSAKKQVQELFGELFEHD
jgi:PadR family transcriptional regulator